MEQQGGRDLPGVNGLDLIAPLLAACPTCKVLMLSGLVTREMVERALDLGAAGYIVKDQQARTIAELIHRASDGTVVLCPAAEAALAARRLGLRWAWVRETTLRTLTKHGEGIANEATTYHFHELSRLLLP